MAAPDYKIRQCIQRSALFPGRAHGGTEGPERGPGGAKRCSHRGAEGVGYRERHRSTSSPRVGYAHEKFSKKSTLKRILSAFLQTESEMVSSAVWARLSIRHYNCYLWT